MLLIEVIVVLLITTIVLQIVVALWNEGSTVVRFSCILLRINQSWVSPPIIMNIEASVQETGRRTTSRSYLRTLKAQP